MCPSMKFLLIFVAAAASASPIIGLFDQHQHALAHVLETGLKEAMPQHGVTLVHLDSHADMSVAKFFEASLNWERLRQHPEEALALSEHNSWVAASWLLGVVNKLIFVEPPWSTEFRTNTHRSFYYTAGTVNGEFKVNIRTADGSPATFEYWHTVDRGDLLPDSHAAEVEDMVDRVVMEVEVIPFEELLTTLPQLLANDQAPLWLDIDMSAFATESPGHREFFQETRIPLRWQQLVAEAWKDVSRVTKQEKPFGSAWWQEHLSAWHEQCPNLQTIFDNEKEEDMHDILRAPPGGIPSASFDPSTAVEMESSVATKLYDQTMLIPDQDAKVTRAEVIRLLAVFESDLENLLSNHEESDAAHMLWSAIVNPIHLSSNKEIDVMIGALGCLLDQLTTQAKVPALVTLARSEFTPTHLVKYIECSLLTILSQAYPTRDIFHNDGFDPVSCDQGYSFHNLGVLGTQVTAPAPLTTPIELVVANVSPEPLVVHWKGPDGALSNDFPVPAFSYDNNNCVSFDNHEWVITTGDGVFVDSKTVSAKDGHTQVWTVTTGLVDTALRRGGKMRHRAL